MDLHESKQRWTEITNEINALKKIINGFFMINEGFNTNGHLNQNYRMSLHYIDWHYSFMTVLEDDLSYYYIGLRDDLDGRVPSSFKQEYENFKFWENHLITQSHNLHQHYAQIMKSRNNKDNILKYLQEARNFNQTLSTNLDHFNSMALERFSYAL